MNNTNTFREIEKVERTIDKNIPVDKVDFKSWLVEEAQELDPQDIYLLSFHDDGVVWGKLKKEGDQHKLITSDDALKNSPSPKFRLETLQECRLFGQNGELLIWRTDGDNFNARRIIDKKTDKPDEIEYFDEPQVLWGREIEYSDEDFTIVREGQGVRHAFPMKLEPSAFQSSEDEKSRSRPLRLLVRHYLAYDEDGCVYINLSRLVKVDVQ